MKRSLCFLICALLMLALAGSAACAEAPAANSLAARYQSVRGNASFTPESYPEVWITPVYADHIITGIDPEKYPAKFLCFSPPEGSAMFKLSYDQSSFINHDALMATYYFAYDRASFELFLEKADEEYILKDGSDGMAIYIQPDSRRARALIDLKPQFGGTSKLEIVLDDYSRDITEAQLKEQIQAEVERVRAEIKLVELDHYWSEGVFESVELHAGYDPVSVVIDTQGLTVTKLEEAKLVYGKPDGRSVANTEIAVDSYSYAQDKEESTDEALKDGTAYRCYNSEYVSYASFTLLEEGKHGPVYLTFRIDCEPEAFTSLLEQAYALVSVIKNRP